MKRMFLPVVLLIAPNLVTAEMYVWVDRDGVKNVSTHPRWCLRHGQFVCQPLTATRTPRTEAPSLPPELATRQDEVEDSQVASTPQIDCERLQAERDQAAADLEKASANAGNLNQGLGSLYAAQPAVGAAHAKLDQAEARLDPCYREIQQVSRQQTRELARARREAASQAAMERSRAELDAMQQRNQTRQDIQDAVKDALREGQY